MSIKQVILGVLPPSFYPFSLLLDTAAAVERVVDPGIVELDPSLGEKKGFRSDRPGTVSKPWKAARIRHAKIHQ